MYQWRNNWIRILYLVQAAFPKLLPHLSLLGLFCVAVYLCFKLFWYNIVIKCRLRVFLWLYYTKRHRILVERINLSLWSRTHCMHILFLGFSVYLLLIRRLFFFLSSCHSKCIYSGINMDKEAKQATSFRWFTF